MRKGLLKYKYIKNINSDEMLGENRVSASNLNGKSSVWIGWSIRRV